MTLPLPNLDDRRWADLVDEGRALLPVHAPDWTDHNVSDPGITLLEILAWVAEMDVFRADRVPERHRRKFLALAGIRPRPPAPASTVLRLGVLSPSPAIDLPAGIEVVGADPSGATVLFTTRNPVTVVPTALVTALRQTGERFHDLTDGLARGEPIQPFGVDPRPGDAFYLGFDAGLPAGATVSLYLLGPDPAEEAAEQARLVEERAAAEAACAAGATTCLVACADAAETNCAAAAGPWPCGPTVIAPPPAPAAPMSESPGDGTPVDGVNHHSARLAWEVAVAPGVWRRLDPERGEVCDTTRALTLGGQVAIRAPATMVRQVIGGVRAAWYYLRCRLERGQYDAAPRIGHVIVNGVEATQAARFAGAGIAPSEAVGTGDPFQRLHLRDAPVVSASVRVFSRAASGVSWTLWEPRDDFDASSPTDAHYVLDPTAGVITFGDGAHGRVVPAGDEIRLDYWVTRAAAGNCAPRSIVGLSLAGSDRRHHWAALDAAARAQAALLPATADALRASVTVDQPIAATGGAAAETLAHGEGRVLAEMTARTRAATIEDIEVLALDVPGTRVARAHARANVHPRMPCYRAPGIITLVVIPHLPMARPMPSAGLRQAISTFLGRRRLVGSRIEVVGPTYHAAAVTAVVQARGDSSRTATRARIEAALVEFFHPLRGGIDGAGWPLGRDVYRSEVLQVIDGVDGVDHVLDLALAGDDGVPSCGNLCVGPFGLVAAGGHAIEVR